MINNLIDVELGYINFTHPDLTNIPEYLNKICNCKEHNNLLEINN